MSQHPRFELQGHRGARGLFPENTLEGFRATIALGVDALELDVGLTSDGVAVVFHDVTLSPDTVRDENGAWLGRADLALYGLTRAELSCYDVGRLRPGSGTASRHPEQVPLDGARIPDLEAVLMLAISTRTGLAIELKTRPDRPDLTAPPLVLADEVMRLVDRTGAASLVDVRSFDWRALMHLGRTRPAIPLTWLTNQQTRRQRDLWWFDAAPDDPVAALLAARGSAPGSGTCWAPELDGLGRADVAEAQAAGLRVVPWTVNEPSDMDRLIEWGADGLCTDRPDLAREVMRSRGVPVPPQA